MPHAPRSEEAATGEEQRSSARVLEEAATRLASEAAGPDHALQRLHRRIVGIAELFVESLEDCGRGIEPDKIEERERPHREVAAALHRRVDVLDARRAVLGQADGVVEIRKEQ